MLYSLASVRLGSISAEQRLVIEPSVRLTYKDYRGSTVVLVERKRTHTTVRKESGTWTLVLWSTFTHHIIHIMGWLGTVSSQVDCTESGCQWRLCTLTSELTVHMLKCIAREHACCPLIYDCSFIHSSLDEDENVTSGAPAFRPWAESIDLF